MTDFKGGEGYCAAKRCRCGGNGDVFATKDFEPDFAVEIDRSDICRKSSIFGNYYISLTDEQIKHLQDGGALFVKDDEYNVFIERFSEKR